MKLRKFYFYFILALIIPTAFGATAAGYEQISIYRFDKELCRLQNGDSAAVSRIESDMLPVVDGFIKPLMPDSTQSISVKLNTFANLKNIFFFYTDVENAFPNLNGIEHTLDTIQGNMLLLFKTRLPRLYSIISPYNQPIIILNDTALAIALNHYLGTAYKPYSYYPPHKRTYKVPRRIPYDVTEATIKTLYPFVPKDSTLIERILYEGMAVYAIKSVFPSATPEMLFSATDEQLKWAKENESLIFSKLNKVAKSNDKKQIAMYFSDGPFSPQISPLCMGCIGRWIGFHLIAKYLRHRSDKKISELLKTKLYHNSDLFINEITETWQPEHLD